MKTRFLLYSALLSITLQAAELPQPFDFKALHSKGPATQQEVLYDFLRKLPKEIQPAQSFSSRTHPMYLKAFVSEANNRIQQLQQQNPILLEAPNVPENNAQQYGRVNESQAEVQLKNKIEELKKKLEEAQKNLTDKNAEAAQDNQQAPQEMIELKQKLNTAEKSLEERAEKVTKLEESIQQKDAQIQILEQQLETQRQALSEKDTLLREKEATLEAMRKEMEEFKQNINAPSNAPAPSNTNDANSNNGNVQNHASVSPPPPPPLPAPKHPSNQRLSREQPSEGLPNNGLSNNNAENAPSIRVEDLQRGTTQLRKVEPRSQKEKTDPSQQPSSEDLKAQLDSLKQVSRDDAPRDYAPINPLVKDIQNHKRVLSLSSEETDLLHKIRREIKDGEFIPKFVPEGDGPKMPMQKDTGNTLYDVLAKGLKTYQDANQGSDSEDSSDAWSDDWSDDEEGNIALERLDNRQEAEEDPERKLLRKIRDVYRKALQVDLDKKWRREHWLIWEYNHYKAPEQQARVDEKVGDYIFSHKEELMKKYQNMDFSQITSNQREGKYLALQTGENEDDSSEEVVFHSIVNL